MKKRIWELDAFRGLCILGVVIVHFVFDLTFNGVIDASALPGWFTFIQDWGNILFFLLSGICVTLGRRHILRGLVVFGGGMLCTLATFLMLKLGFFDINMMIYFGVLHCLGACMLLWCLFKKLPRWSLLFPAIVFIAAGLYLDTHVLVDFPWLLPFGFVYPNFNSSDYFPLFPNLGYFLLGAVLGSLLYRKKQSLLPKVNPKYPIVATLSFCGRHSLLIYLLHQPILFGLATLLGG